MEIKNEIKKIIEYQNALLLKPDRKSEATINTLIEKVSNDYDAGNFNFSNFSNISINQMGKIRHTKMYQPFSPEETLCIYLKRLLDRKFHIKYPNRNEYIRYKKSENMEKNVKINRFLRKFGRPIMNTEWLARPMGSQIFDLFSLFYLENVSCFNRGLVAGKSQYFECWNNLWDRYNKGVDEDIDFRLWFHDLFRPSHRPYEPKETELIRRICDLAEQGKE